MNLEDLEIFRDANYACQRFMVWRNEEQVDQFGKLEGQGLDTLHAYGEDSLVRVVYSNAFPCAFLSENGPFQ